jgi:hypothetical protein
MDSNTPSEKDIIQELENKQINSSHIILLHQILEETNESIIKLLELRKND